MSKNEIILPSMMLFDYIIRRWYRRRYF